MPRTTLSSGLPHAASAVFDWFTRPGAPERLIAPTLRPVEWHRVDTPEGYSAQVRIAEGLHAVRWHNEVRFDRAARRLHEVAHEGPYPTFVRTVSVEPDGAGCTLHEQIDWEPHRGPMTALFGVGAAERRLAGAMRFRHRRLIGELDRLGCLGPDPLHVVLSGASGLVGRALALALSAGGHRVTRLVRHTAGEGEVRWSPLLGRLDAAALEGVDAVVHLSGENILQRWTPAAKQAIRASRVDTTDLLARALADLRHPPKVFIAASAVGFYGDRGDVPCTEISPPGRGFLAELCQAWEAATAPAAAAGIRVVNLRIGVVLSAQGGALATMVPAFSSGAGGTVGSGEQMISWVNLDDVLGAILFSVGRGLEGPVNVCAPTPVSSGTLSRALATTLGRPAAIPVPAPMVRLLFGEMADEVILSGVAALPRALLGAGYRFAVPSLDETLRLETGRYAE